MGKRSVSVCVAWVEARFLSIGDDCILRCEIWVEIYELKQKVLTKYGHIEEKERLETSNRC